MTELLMSFGLRDWLLVLGPVFIVTVLMHGYWRMRMNRNSLKMALDKSFMSDLRTGSRPEDDLSLFKAELPNGGARIRKIPEQTALNLQKAVPVLMDPVEETREDGPDLSTRASSTAEATRVEPKVKPKTAALPEKFVVIYVISEQQPFAGQALREALVEHQMVFGEMDIFHRQDAQGEPLFSLVNAIEPGTFDLNTMSQLEFPAISLFLRVHELNDPAAVFDDMIALAQGLADDLGGQVKDESRSVMTTQTIDFCRLDIQRYQHRHQQKNGRK